jgi:hypothetical protein
LQYFIICWSLFVLFLLAIVMSIPLRFTEFDYPMVIFKLFWLSVDGDTEVVPVNTSLHGSQSGDL